MKHFIAFLVLLLPAAALGQSGDYYVLCRYDYSAFVGYMRGMCLGDLGCVDYYLGFCEPVSSSSPESSPVLVELLNIGAFTIGFCMVTAAYFAGLPVRIAVRLLTTSVKGSVR